MRRLFVLAVLVVVMVFMGGCCQSPRERFGNLHNF